MNLLFLEDTTIDADDLSTINVFKIVEDVQKEFEKYEDKPSKKDKNDLNKSKHSEKAKEILSIIKSVYKMDEKDLANAVTIRKVVKLTIRSAFTYGVFLANPVAGILTFIVDKHISKKTEIEQREQLLKLYRDQLKFVEERLEKVENPKERYKLIKIKSSLESNIDKLTLFKRKEEE